MQSFYLSTDELNELKRVKLSPGIISSECDLYYFPENIDNQNLLFKSFLINDDKIFANKMQKLTKIEEAEAAYPLSEFVYPNGYVYVDGILKGITLPYIEGANLKRLLNNPLLPFENKIQLLYNVGSFLDKMHYLRTNTRFKNFYLYDLHESNFMIERQTKSLKVVDVDGTSIDGFSPEKAMYLNPLTKFNQLKEKYPSALNSSGKRVIAPSQNTDLYCYYIMILNLIAQENISLLSPLELMHYLEYLDTLGYNSDFLAFCQTIYSMNENQNPKDLLETLSFNDKSSYKSYVRSRRL